jgi:hypothetical protein
MVTAEKMSPNKSQEDGLAQLRQWLHENLESSDRAIFATESIRSFLTQHIIHNLMVTEVSITAKQAQFGVHVWLHFLTSEPFDSLEQSVEVNRLNKVFTYAVAIPLLPNPSVHTEFFPPESQTEENFEQLILLICASEESQHFGTFINTLRQE